SPPRDEIGYGLAVVAAGSARPERVTLLDLRDSGVRSQGLLRYLLGNAGPTALQLGISGAGLALQRVLAALPLHAAAQAPASQLRRVLYLRPLVGVGETIGGDRKS